MYLAMDVIEILGYGSSERMESEIFWYDVETNSATPNGLQ
jgi:hypothetical protein